MGNVRGKLSGKSVWDKLTEVNVWGMFKGMFDGEEMSRGISWREFPRKAPCDVRMPMEGYKFVRALVMICATLVSIQKHRQTTFEQLYYYLGQLR